MNAQSVARVLFARLKPWTGLLLPFWWVGCVEHPTEGVSDRTATGTPWDPGRHLAGHGHEQRQRHRRNHRQPAAMRAHGVLRLRAGRHVQRRVAMGARISLLLHKGTVAPARVVRYNFIERRLPAMLHVPDELKQTIGRALGRIPSGVFILTAEHAGLELDAA